MINQAIAREIQVTVEYMQQHVQWSDVKHFTVQDDQESIAFAEMKHVKVIVERMFYLGEKPTTKPAPIFVGDNFEEMITADKKANEDAIEHYKKILRKALGEGDETTNRLFRRILADEEFHQNTFMSLLEEI